jgi:Fe-S-cluster-containing dehydrogenase component
MKTTKLGEKRMKCLVAYPEKCVGCKNCVYACSNENEGFFEPLLSRIQVYSQGSKRLYIPSFCLQCGENAPCIQACPTGALKYNPDLGAVLWQKNSCINCLLCIPVCPYKAIKFDVLTKSILICDLCSGHPICVQVCPVEALQFQELDAETENQIKLHSRVMKDFFKSE